MAEITIVASLVEQSRSHEWVRTLDQDVGRRDRSAAKGKYELDGMADQMDALLDNPAGYAARFPTIHN